MSWEQKYIGQPWTKEHDCVWHVKSIYQKELGVHIPNVAGMGVRQRATTLLEEKEAKYIKVKTPVEFDLILLKFTGGSQEIHIGIYSEEDGGGVIHAVESSGVVFRSLTDMQCAGWEIVTKLRYTA